MSKRCFSLVLFSLLLGGCAKAPFLAHSKNAQDAYEECHRHGEKKDYEDSIKCFEIMKSRYPGSVQSAEAELEIADNYYRKKDYLVAAESYKAFITFHPIHDRTPYAYYQTGMCYLKASPKQIDRDQKYLDDSLHHFDATTQFIDSDVHDSAKEKAREVRKKIASRHYYVGKFYYRTKEYRAAIPRFNEIVTHYTDLGFDEASLYFMGEAYRHLAEKDKALEILGVMEQHFPQGHYRKKLASHLGIK